MRTTIPFIALSFSALLLFGCPDGAPSDTDGGTGGTDGGSGGTDGGSGGTDGGSGGTDGGTGGAVGNACGAGTACNSDDGDSGDWCVANVCGSQENLTFAFCNDSLDNPNADGEFGCGCVAGQCSRTPENNCFAPTDCTLGPDGDTFCLSVCESECGGELRDSFCAGSGPDTAFCECFCHDGTGTCFN